MRVKKVGYVFNLYDRNSNSIRPFSKKITHFGQLDSFVVNIFENVNLPTKAAIDEFILEFEELGYFSPLQCCFLAATANKDKLHVTLEELAMWLPCFWNIKSQQGRYRICSPQT
jgi:hypothetical protein